MHIVPAIDIIDGKCVRLSKGDYDSVKTYHDDPLEMALRFQDAGLTRLHLVDLDGARSSHIVNWRSLERITSKTSLTVDFGGGVKSGEDLRTVMESGASMATLGSIAVSDPASTCEWLSHYGPDHIILGADAKDGFIRTNGWKEGGSVPLDQFLADYISKGVKRTICTDINRDGMLQGPAVDLYRKILATHPNLILTASGGVSSASDLYQLKEAGLPEAIVGKAYYEGRVTLAQLTAIETE